jgi:hypothetical protein
MRHKNIINGFLIIFKGDMPHRFDRYASIPEINPGIGLQNNITWDNTN